MRRQVALASLALTALTGVHALAGAPTAAARPRFASLAQMNQVAHRTTAIGRADQLAMWGAEPQPADTPEHTTVARLAVGQAVFWQGGYVGQQVVTEQVPTAQACRLTRCWSWQLVLAQAPYRLRVGIDTPSRESMLTVELLDGSGATVASATNDNRFNTELFVVKPARGTYTVRVVPRDAAYAAFRLRAKAEAAPVPYRRRTELLPNLQATPPYEFGFVAPANPANAAYPPDTVNPPLDVAGYHPVSCSVDEAQADGVTRCLRFTTGPRNAGAGPMDLGYTPYDSDLGVLNDGPVTQYVHWSDGSTTTRAAGRFQFHKTHAHYHYQDILDYSLFRVAGHALVPAGKGTKSGFSPADQLFADWHTFGQEQGQYVEGVSSSRSVGASTFGLSTGWGDVYRWQRPGQYVDFGTNGDGRYVIRSVVDINNHVLESDEHDNAAYAYVQITGDTVRIIERGQGMSPWDPKKKVFTDR